jgi:DsbC/DsbD-like thiol-disulfide interchange protein
LGLAAISYDSPAVLRNFAQRRRITFPLLSDEGSKTIRAFGILNADVSKGTPFYGIPHPGTYIVDTNARVVAKYFEDDFRQRYTASDILVTHFGAAAGASHVTAETQHLRLSASASADHARPGQRIALTLDVDLKPGMHVYAPGVEGYIGIDWSMKSSPAVTAHPVQFPPSKQITLPAIGETVSAYEGQFRLLRDITISDQKTVKPLLGTNGELTIEGNFRYQACDDRICYVPKTVPLRWTIRVEPLDTERAPAELQRKPNQR